MKPKHTPEPWRIGSPGYILKDAPNFPIIVACALDRGTERAETDAERIVACVNALAGVANPAAVADVIKALQLIVSDVYSGVVIKMDCAQIIRALDALTALKGEVNDR